MDHLPLALEILGFTAVFLILHYPLLAWSTGRDGDADWSLGARDEEPHRSVRTARIARAMDNLAASLPLFTVAAGLSAIGSISMTTVAICSWAYFIARLVYLPAYVFHWGPVRPVAFGVGILSTLALLLAALT